MKKSERALISRNILSLKFAKQKSASQLDRPTHGWVRAIRDALGMSARQLAKRMHMSQAAITQLERSEVAGTIRIETLRRLADAMNCDLTYAVVPRQPLEEIVMNQARQRATRDLAAINHTMLLENQKIAASEVALRIEDYANKLVATGKLWDDLDN